MPCTLDLDLFENWQATFASRIGREQIPHAAVADYRALCRIFDSDAEYHAAAQHVYEHWQSWSAWPAPIEFERARATLRRIPGAEIRATLAMIDESRRLIAAPRDGTPTLEHFAHDWRAQLGDCEPKDSGMARIRAILARPDDGPWLSNPNPPSVRAASAAAARERRDRQDVA